MMHFHSQFFRDPDRHPEQENVQASEKHESYYISYIAEKNQLGDAPVHEKRGKCHFRTVSFQYFWK